MVLRYAAAIAVLLLRSDFCEAYHSTMLSPRSVYMDHLWYKSAQINTLTRSSMFAPYGDSFLNNKAVQEVGVPDLLEIGGNRGFQKMQQPTSNSFEQLLHAPDVAEFSFLLKQMAAKRRRISDSYRPALSRAVLERLDQLNDDFFSDCVWSIGTLRCNVNDFSAISTTLHGNDSATLFWDKVASVSETASRLCITRLAIGLGKMGIRWDSLPASTRASLINLVQNKRFPGDPESRVNSVPESRELATILFTLGQLGVTTDLLPEGAMSRVLDEVAGVAINFTPQGLSNALHGLARMGVMWSELPLLAQVELPTRGAAIIAEMRSDELCSILQSMAVMKVQWSSLPPKYRAELLGALEVTLPSLNNRELSNIFWALGKTNVNYINDLSASFREILMESLLSAAVDVKLFDLESIFVGLGLMQVNFEGLSSSTQEFLLSNVERHLAGMNIFCTYNVLWGLARMGVSVSHIGSPLSCSILEKVVTVLHTFLPTQYGDVIWSLGSIGFKKTDLSPVMSDRLLAVLSRVYGKLHVRAAAYTLWGLSKMGFQWDEMKMRTRSLAGGREADPLSESVIKYLRSRVASMKEHEYSVMLYSLGGLRAQLDVDAAHALPSYVTDKIHHRATRVSSFLTSRSLASSLHGLGKCNVEWMKLPVETRDAWEEALLRPSASAPQLISVTEAASSSRGTDSGADRRGLAGMRTVEFCQTLYGLGLMRVSWQSLKQGTREAIVREVLQPGRIDSMDLHGVSSGIWGLAAMQCPLHEIPAALLTSAKTRLWATAATSSASDTMEGEGERVIAGRDGDNDSETPLEEISEDLSISDTASMESEPVARMGNQWKQLTSVEGTSLSFAMSLEAMGRLGVVLSADELREISLRLHSMAPHMSPDSIISCTSGLSQLGALWSDLTAQTRMTWVSALKVPPEEISATKRQGLAESLAMMKAF